MIKLGCTADGKTVVFGEINKPITKIYISGKLQVAANEFVSILNRMGEINGDMPSTVASAFCDLNFTEVSKELGRHPPESQK